MTAASGAEAASRFRLVAALGLLVVACGMVIGVFVAGLWAGTYYSQTRVAAIVTGAVAVVAWLVASMARPHLLPRSRLFGALAAGLGGLAIPEAAARVPRFGFDYLGYAVLLAGLYLLLVRAWQSAYIAVRLPVLIAIASGLVGVAAIAAHVALWLRFWEQLGYVTLPPLRLGYEGLWLGSPNALAALQVLLLLACAPSLWVRGSAGRWTVTALAALIAVGIVLSASRGAWLGSGIALAGIAIAAAADPRARSVISTARRRVGALPLAGAGLVLVMAAATLGPALLTRLTDTSGLGIRGAFIAQSQRMFAASPIAGLGPGSWVPSRVAFAEPSEPDYYIPHAHNIVAHTLAELGLIGALAGIVALALLAALVVRGLRAPAPIPRMAAWAALAATLFLGGQQMVDEFVHQPAILIAFALPIARLDAVMSPLGTPVLPGRFAGRALSASLLVATLVATGATLWPEPSARFHESAIEAADDERWTETRALEDAAIAGDPLLPPYEFLGGLAAAHDGDLESARARFARVVELDDFPTAWLNLAAVHARLGERSAALSGLDRALRIGRQQPAVALGAASVFLELGDTTAATDALADVLALVPSLASDPALVRDPWRPIVGAAIDRAVAVSEPWSRFLLAVEGGRLEAARSEIGRVDVGLRQVATLFLDAWTGDQRAFAALHARAAATPLDATLVGLCLRAARHHDPALSTQGWECTGSWWFGVYPIARLGSIEGQSLLAGPAAYPHWLYAYRRPGPRNPFVPWLPKLGATIA